MCSHYEAVVNRLALEMHFGVGEPLPLGLEDSLYPGFVGPFIRRHEYTNVGDDAVPFRELLTGTFGLIPHWAEDTKIARKTYNARSETVDLRNSFKDAWFKGRHCIIPANAIYEPDWRSGKAIPTRIVRADGRPMGIAGIWAKKKFGDGKILHSFSMLTVNADHHEFMRNYHRPGTEKRMVVILHEEQYDGWLSADAKESTQYLNQFPAELMATAGTV